MKQKGGKRPGAGRKKGGENEKTRKKRIIEAEARAFLINKYLSHWEILAKKALDLAEGHIKVVEYHGKLVQVYDRAPDAKTLQNIIETVIGKATQPLNGSINMPQLQELTENIRTILTKKTTKP